MTRPSTIDVLPAEIQSEIGRLRMQGCTIDQIVAHLRRMHGVTTVIPESMQLEFVDATDKAAGAVLYEKRMDFLNREVSKLVLGGTAGTEAISGGHAVGREHRAAEDDVEKFDAFKLNTTINRQLVPLIISLTFGPQEEYPLITIGRPDEVPLGDLVESITNLGALGLTVKAAQVRERLGMDPPEDDDELIGGMPAAVPKPPHPTPARSMVPDAFAARPGGLFSGLITRHAEAPDELMDALTNRLAEDAAGALGGLTDQVRAAFMAAEDMHDLARRVARLDLSSDQFADTMARGMALANMVGQASLVEEMDRERRNG